MMIKPPIPENDEQRVCVLRSLSVLDTEMEERFDRITRIAQKLFNVPIALISLVDTNRQWFKSRMGVDAPEMPRDVSFCGHTILDDEIMTIEDTHTDPRFHDNPLVVGDPKIRFYSGCPLKISNEYNVGSLCVIDNKPRTLNADDLAMLRDLANMVQTELTSIQLSSTDELTNLSNRRGFLSIARHAISLCQRLEKPMALLYFDLDKFKEINDTYGHAEGDKVLKTFSSALLDTFRESDVIARLGGDEFCVLCSNVETEKMLPLVERLSEKLKTAGMNECKIGYSVGLMDFQPEKHKTIECLLHDADKKMYDYKIKNRTHEAEFVLR